jgi:hypothetical protein
MDAPMIGGVRTPAVWAALTDPALEPVNLARADAYPRRYAFLTRRTLPTGAIGFVPLTPRRDVALISTEAMLAVRDDLHPAIVNRLLELIRDEHGDQGYFEAPNEFPNVEQVDLRVSPDAGRRPPSALRAEPALPLHAVLNGDVPRALRHRRGAAGRGVGAAARPHLRSVLAHVPQAWGRDAHHRLGHRCELSRAIEQFRSWLRNTDSLESPPALDSEKTCRGPQSAVAQE